MAEEACCTCATLLRNISPQYNEKTEKPSMQNRRLECCNRVICGDCIQNNSRFAAYCPFCQISTIPTSLPQGLRNPPSYTESAANHSSYDPPPYAASQLPIENEKAAPPQEDILHFLDHRVDTVTSLAFRYGIPIDALRKKNNLTSDQLLFGRRTVTIPGEYASAITESLSPMPIEGEEEERRKAKIRKFMVSCKVHEYDVAVLYLKEAEYDLDLAIGVYQDDEKWESEHPAHPTAKGKESSFSVLKRRFIGQKS